jgi:hypothetical protein
MTIREIQMNLRNAAILQIIRMAPQAKKIPDTFVNKVMSEIQFLRTNISIIIVHGRTTSHFIVVRRKLDQAMRATEFTTSDGKAYSPEALLKTMNELNTSISADRTDKELVPARYHTLSITDAVYVYLRVAPGVATSIMDDIFYDFANNKNRGGWDLSDLNVSYDKGANVYKLRLKVKSYDQGFEDIYRDRIYDEIQKELGNRIDIVRKSQTDKALIAIGNRVGSPYDVGGIDLNSANLNLQIKRDGKGAPLPLVQQDMAQLSHIQGFEPEIIEIKAAMNLPILSELQQKLQSP